MAGKTNALAGRAIIVTGASRGIGREIALLCAREGASVVNDLGGAVAFAIAQPDEVDVSEIIVRPTASAF